MEQYESFDYLCSNQQFATAQHIFVTYLTPNSQFEVNVDDKVRKSVITSIKSQQNLRHCFNDAKRAVLALLEVSFAQFMRSNAADMMKRDIGKHHGKPMKLRIRVYVRVYTLFMTPTNIHMFPICYRRSNNPLFTRSQRQRNPSPPSFSRPPIASLFRFCPYTGTLCSIFSNNLTDRRHLSTSTSVGANNGVRVCSCVARH